MQRARVALAGRGLGILTEIDVVATMKTKHAAVQRHRARGSAGTGDVSAIDPIASMQAIENPALGAAAGEVQILLKAVINDLQPSRLRSLASAGAPPTA